MTHPRPRTRSLFDAFMALWVSVMSISAQSGLPAPTPASNQPKYPFPEKLSYRVEWRRILAGTAVLDVKRAQSNMWQTDLDLQSAGLVTRLYAVQDTYKVMSDDRFCTFTSALDAQEGKRHKVTRATFQQARRKLSTEEHDLVKKSTSTTEIDMAPCTREIAGALSALRAATLEPGKSMTMPITNGKKVVNARVEAQAKETLKVGGQSRETIRYEAFLFDDVLYPRKGRLLIWITNDGERVPVQMTLQLGFPIYTIQLFLDKQEKL